MLGCREGDVVSFESFVDTVYLCCLTKCLELFTFFYIHFNPQHRPGLRVTPPFNGLKWNRLNGIDRTSWSLETT